MNFDTFNAIKDDGNLKANEKYFYMLVVNYASEKGYAYPSYEQLMRDMNTTNRRTISNIIKRLETDGYIKYNKGNSSKKANEYYPLKHMTSTENEHSDKSATSGKSVTSTSGKSVTSTSGKSATPNKNKKKNKKKNIYSASNDDLEKQTEEIWSLYPSKKGKAIAIKKIPKLIKECGYKQLERCINRYKNSKEDWRQWQNGSTFFNGGYVDYLDKNFVENTKTNAMDKSYEDSIMT